MPGVRLQAGQTAPIRGSWAERAVCKGRNDLFFVERGKPQGPARKLCYNECPVFDECAAYAERLRPAYGLWAGQSTRQRLRGKKTG